MRDKGKGIWRKARWEYINPTAKGDHEGVSEDVTYRLRPEGC